MADEKKPTETKTTPAADDAAAKDLKRQELQNQLAALEDKPTPVSELTDQSLQMAFFDALVTLLGSHPALDVFLQEMKARQK